MQDSLFKGPAVVPFVECPNCDRLVEFEVEWCPGCREEIEPVYALMSAYVVHKNTQACSMANTIKSADPFIAMAVIGVPLIYAMDWYVHELPSLMFLTLLWPLTPLLAIAVWHWRFGRFHIGDLEYQSAKREMRWRLLVWLVIVIVQVLLLKTIWPHASIG